MRCRRQVRSSCEKSTLHPTDVFPFSAAIQVELAIIGTKRTLSSPLSSPPYCSERTLDLDWSPARFRNFSAGEAGRKGDGGGARSFVLARFPLGVVGLMPLGRWPGLKSSISQRRLAAVIPVVASGWLTRRWSLATSQISSKFLLCRGFDSLLLTVGVIMEMALRWGDGGGMEQPLRGRAYQRRFLCRSFGANSWQPAHIVPLHSQAEGRLYQFS